MSQQPPWNAPPPQWAPPPGGPPPPWQPPPPRRMSTPMVVLLSVVVGVVLLFGGCAVTVVGLAAVGSSVDTTAATPVTAPREPAEEPAPVGLDTATTTTAAPTTTEPPGIGDPVRDGQFEFTVRGVDCSRERVGDGYLVKEAQGRFCLVDVDVANVGDEPRMFDASQQRAYDGDGRQYETDEANLYLEDSGKAFLEEINPGNSVQSQLVFDVPDGTELRRLELHDGFLSGGVEVTL